MTLTTNLSITRLALLAALSSSLAACGSSDSGSDSSSPKTTDTTSTTTDEPSNSESIYDDFEIELNQTVEAGAFRIYLTKAEVKFDSNSQGYITFPFTADNLDDESQIPLYDLGSEGVSIEINGKYYYGSLNDDTSVPGYRTGENIFWFDFEGEDLTPEDIASGTVYLGKTTDNQVIIPLSAPTETVTLAAIPLDPIEVTYHYGAKLTLDENQVQYSYYSGNEQLEAGTARIILTGTALGGTDHSCLDADQLVLLRKDGISVEASVNSRPCVDGNEIEDVVLGWDVPMPVEGTYEITIVGEKSPAYGDADDAVFEVTVPSAE